MFVVFGCILDNNLKGYVFNMIYKFFCVVSFYMSQGFSCKYWYIQSLVEENIIKG